MTNVKDGAFIRRMDSLSDVDILTDGEALAIVRYAKDRLIAMLQTFERGVALDDGGDYLAAAIDNYHTLFHAYWDNDGVSEHFVPAVKAWLKDKDDWGGSDGEIRFDVFTDRFVEEEVYKG